MAFTIPMQSLLSYHHVFSFFKKIKSPRYFSEYGEKGVEIPIVHAHMINSSVRLIKVRLELQVF